MLTADAQMRADRIIQDKEQLLLSRQQTLIAVVNRGLPELIDLSNEFNRVYEDGIYRFYHCSFKVYFLQEATSKAFQLFKQIGDEVGLEFFTPYKKFIDEGTDKEFDMSHNEDWSFHTRPIVEAFLHTKYLLDMMVKYGNELDEMPEILPSGFAAILCLYKLR